MAYSKYKNIKVIEDGIKFDSKMEKDYYLYLQQLKDKNIIKEIKMQTTYSLQEKFRYKGEAIREINYKADFVVLYSDGHEEVIDIKGLMIDPVFKVKRKMLIYKYPNIDFRVLTRKGKKGNYIWEQIM